MDGSFIEDLEFGKHSWETTFGRLEDKEKEDNGGENELGKGQIVGRPRASKDLAELIAFLKVSEQQRHTQQVEEELEGEMKAGDSIRNSVRNPGKGTKTG